MEEKTARELIHDGFEDMNRWIAEAETTTMKKHRMEVVLGVISNILHGEREQFGNEEFDDITTAFHYFRDGSSTVVDKTEKEMGHEA